MKKSFVLLHLDENGKYDFMESIYFRYDFKAVGDKLALKHDALNRDERFHPDVPAYLRKLGNKIQSLKIVGFYNESFYFGHGHHKSPPIQNRPNTYYLFEIPDYYPKSSENNEYKAFKFAKTDDFLLRVISSSIAQFMLTQMDELRELRKNYVKAIHQRNLLDFLETSNISLQTEY